MKFTFEEKLAAVKLHKEKGTYKYPKGYNTRNGKKDYRSFVRFWEAQYDRGGENGIRHGLNSAYSPEKKLEIITPVLMGGNHLQTAGGKLWRAAFVNRFMDQKI